MGKPKTEQRTRQKRKSMYKKLEKKKFYKNGGTIQTDKAKQKQNGFDQECKQNLEEKMKSKNVNAPIKNAQRWRKTYKEM